MLLQKIDVWHIISFQPNFFLLLLLLLQKHNQIYRKKNVKMVPDDKLNGLTNKI